MEIRWSYILKQTHDEVTEVSSQETERHKLSGKGLQNLKGVPQVFRATNV